MTEKFIVRPYKKGDEEPIIELLKNSFPAWANRNKAFDYWKWKYLDAPMKSIIMVGEDNGKIIGVGHDITYKTKIGSSIYVSQYGDDYATHQEYRGLGVYTDITKAINKIQEDEMRINYSYSLSTNPIIINKSRQDIDDKIKFQFTKPLTHLIRVKDIQRHIDNKFINKKKMALFGYTVLKGMNRIVNTFTSKKYDLSDYTIEDLKYFDSDFDIFWDEIKDNYNFINEKRSEYLNYRYCDPRGGRYVIKKLIEKGVFIGLIVLELKKSMDYYEGYIVDLLTLSNKTDAVDALVKGGCDFFDALGVNSIHYQTLKGQTNNEVFLKNEFINASTPDVFITYTLIDMPEAVSSLLKTSPPDKIYFTYGSYF